MEHFDHSCISCEVILESFELNAAIWQVFILDVINLLESLVPSCEYFESWLWWNPVPVNENLDII